MHFRSQRNTNIKAYFLETGFDVIPEVPGRRGHLPRLISDGHGLFLFVDPGSLVNPFMYYSFMCLFGALASAEAGTTDSIRVLGISPGISTFRA